MEDSSLEVPLNKIGGDMFKPVLFVLVPCSLFALTLSKDTIYSYQFQQDYSWIDTLLENNTPDTIRVDSLSVRVVEIHTSTYELNFCLQGIVGGATCWQLGDWVGRTVSRDGFAVEPQGVLTARRSSVCLDMCCACPTRKTVAAAGLNEPLVVMLYFYSNSGMDSLTVVSIQKIISMDVKNNALIKPKNVPEKNIGTCNLKGQAVISSEVTSVEIKKGDKRVKVKRW
jgi:hypothetical protein